MPDISASEEPAPEGLRQLDPLVLANGRRIALCETGDPDGEIAVYLHGTGSSRLEVGLYGAAAAAHGVRLVAWDRPGSGGSDRSAGPNRARCGCRYRRRGSACRGRSTGGVGPVRRRQPRSRVGVGGTHGDQGRCRAQPGAAVGRCRPCPAPPAEPDGDRHRARPSAGLPAPGQAVGRQTAGGSPGRSSGGRSTRRTSRCCSDPKSFGTWYLPRSRGNDSHMRLPQMR